MKNKLLPLIFVLGCYSAYSQVGIGKLNPNASAQLEVFASDKGMLIPRVKLTGTTDATTIVKGNVESLLVFNTETISDVIPGYYYWFNGKWNKFIVSGESTGIAGGQGLPGNKGEAGYPGDSVAMYIDNETGKVYIRDPKDPDKWIQLTSKNGIDGIAGATGAPGTAGSITTLDAIVKDPAGNIYVYVGTDNTVAGRDSEWASKSPNWVKINGLDGKDGKDGVIGGQGVPGNKGEAGYPGDNIAMYIDNQTGTVYIRDPKNPDKWIPLTGKNGIDGIAGVDGAPGTAGSITTLDAIVKDPAGNIYAYVGTDNTVAGRDAEWASKSANWVKINGLDGTNGITGATGAPGTAGSITTLDAIVKDPAGNIYAYIGTDNTVAGRDAEWASKSPNWVKINGLNGANGITGATGAPGTAGSITTLDAIVKDPAGNIYAYVGTDNTVAGRDAEWAAKSPNWVKINGLDGTNGITGATGAPGTAGSITTLDAIVKDPNGIIYAYVGTDNTVAGRDAEWASKSPNWVPLNGKNGLDGKNGIAGGEGLPGTKGLDDTVQMYIDYTKGTVYVRDPNDPTKWVEANKETPTTLKYNQTSATLTYTGETETEIIPLKDISTETPDTVLKITGGTAASFAATTVDIVPSEVKGDVLTTGEDGKVTWKAPVKSNVMAIKVITEDYTLTDEDYTIIAEGLAGDITINLPDPTANKGRMLVINQFDITKQVNFNYNLHYAAGIDISYLTASMFAGVTSGSLKVTLQSSGEKWYVITYTM